MLLCAAARSPASPPRPPTETAQPAATRLALGLCCMRACHAGCAESPCTPPTHLMPSGLPLSFVCCNPCCRLQISLVRKRMHALGADTRVMGVFLENHDTDRFLSARSAGTTPLANSCPVCPGHLHPQLLWASCMHPTWCIVGALPSVTCNSAEPQAAAPPLLQGQPARLPQCSGLHPPLRVHPHHVGLLRCFLSSRLGVARLVACCVCWSAFQLLLSD